MVREKADAEAVRGEFEALVPGKRGADEMMGRMRRLR